MKYFPFFALALLFLSLNACSNTSSDMPKVCRDAMKEQDHSKRIKLYTECIETNKLTADKLVNFYLYRGISYDILGQYPNAVSDFKKAIEMKPGNANTINIAIGDSYRKSGEFKNAIMSYDKVIQSSPNNIQAYNKRGISYGQLRQYDRAIEDLNKAIELSPQDVTTLYARGYTYSLTGQHKNAIDDFNKILDLKPTDQGAYYYRAISYEKLGQYEQAVTDFNKVIDLNPGDPSNYNSLALLYITAEDNKYIDASKAVSLAQKATKLTEEKKGDYLKTLGAAYAKLGQFDKAIETQTKAVSIAEKAGNNSLIDDYRNILASYQEKQQTLSTK